MTQTAAHKTCADVFKSQRRAVKKFERRDVFGDRDKRKFEIDGFGANLKKLVFVDFVADIRLDDFERDLLFRFSAEFAPKIFR